jgi:site-specific recombinase XerD
MQSPALNSRRTVLLYKRLTSACVHPAGQKAKLPFQCHAHMLRHSAGYKLAGDGHDTRSIQAYLGHSDIRHTVRYTELSPKPFRDFWR